MIAATAKLTSANANNTADNVEKKRIIVTAAGPASRLQQIVRAVQHAKIKSPQMSIVYAAKSVVNRKTRASKWQQNVVQSALNLSVPAAKTSESQTVESTAQSAKQP